MGKWEKWYNSQNESTKIWLNSQPVWHDGDLIKSFVFGWIAGIIFLGLIVSL